MRILIRVIGWALRHRGRIGLAYLTSFAALSLSLVIPALVGFAINLIVSFEPGVDGEIGRVQASENVDGRILWVIARD